MRYRLEPINDGIYRDEQEERVWSRNVSLTAGLIGIASQPIPPRCHEKRRRARWQEDRRDVFRDVEPCRRVPASTIKQQNSMGALSDMTRDFVEMKLHGEGHLVGAILLARAGPQAVNSLKLRMDPSLKPNQKNSNAIVQCEDEASLGVANL